MKNALKALILVPLAVIAITFAVANRQMATISLDPFNTEAPALALSAPLFLAILLMVMRGRVIGAIAAWLSQGHVRATARRDRAETHRLRKDLQEVQLELDLVHRQSAAQRSDLPALVRRDAA